jgi:DNA repair protein RecN (Recombination protein N)
MLLQLTVQNYALIDAAEIEFEPGMTAITGETGSGKSIVLGAFGLLLGTRADAKSMKDPDKKCIVEAVFRLKDSLHRDFFNDHDLDYEQEITVRRELSPGGRSRAFINDTPVSLQVLKEFGEKLVDIHSQHENSILGNRAFQFEVVDAFAENEEQLTSYRSVFEQWQKVSKELDNVLSNEARIKSELDFVKFQWEELDKAQLETLHQEVMEQELETLVNAESIKSQLALLGDGIHGEEQSAVGGLQKLRPLLQKVSAFHPQLLEFLHRLESCTIELRELGREVEVFEGSIHYDQEKINSLQEQLNQLYQLQQKHRAQDVSALITLRDGFAQTLQQGETLDDKIQLLAAKKQLLQVQLEELVTALSLSRQKGALATEQTVASYFAALSLEHAELQIEISPSAQFHSLGADEIRFLFRANPGSPLLPVKQVASGGEISRVMLAIKAAIANKKSLPVLILDEIDQGVSGEVGKKIGALLKRMSDRLQVITITHLPQIAGKANQHLKVSKSTDLRTTTTQVQPLLAEARVKELAEMLSGKSYSPAALENARELMK